MKACAISILTAALLFGSSVPVFAQAQGGGATEGFVTQGELAQRLVERLGLWRLLDAKPTDTECFGVLLAAGITPSEKGWDEDEPVTVAVLVRVLVLSLEGGELVAPDQRDNPEAWTDALRTMMEDMGLIETVEGALSVLVPDEGIRNVIEWFTLTSDELERRQISDSEIMRVMRDFFQQAPKRRDITPDFPEG